MDFDCVLDRVHSFLVIRCPVWHDNPSDVVIRPQSLVIGYRNQLRHIAVTRSRTSRYFESVGGDLESTTEHERSHR